MPTGAPDSRSAFSACTTSRSVLKAALMSASLDNGITLFGFGLAFRSTRGANTTGCTPTTPVATTVANNTPNPTCQLARQHSGTCNCVPSSAQRTRQQSASRYRPNPADGNAAGVAIAVVHVTHKHTHKHAHIHTHISTHRRKAKRQHPQTHTDSARMAHPLTGKSQASALPTRTTSPVADDPRDSGAMFTQ